MEKRSESSGSKDLESHLNNRVKLEANAARKNERKSRLAIIDDSRLLRLNTRPSLFEYLKLLHARRHFIAADAQQKSFKTGQGMFLGRMWLILQPLFEVSVYILIFGVVLNVSRGIENFVGYLIIGVVFFRFVSRGINAGSGLIQSSRAMISSFSFPRAALVLSKVYNQFLENIIPAVVAVTLARLLLIPEKPSWTMALIVPIYILLHLFILGVVFIVARLTAFIPDIKSLVSLVTRALFFTSGIFFSLERFDGNPTLRGTMQANPVYQFLTAARDVTIYNALPSLETTLTILGWTLGLLILGGIFFWRAEERYTSVS